MMDMMARHALTMVRFTGIILKASMNIKSTYPVFKDIVWYSGNVSPARINFRRAPVMFRFGRYLSPPTDLLVRLGTICIYAKLDDSTAGVPKHFFIRI